MQDTKKYILLQIVIITINKTTWDIYKTYNIISNITNKTNFDVELLVSNLFIKIYTIIRYKKPLFHYFILENIFECNRIII